MRIKSPRNCAHATTNFCFGAHGYNDDVIIWKHFPRYWAFVWGHRSPVNSPHKGQWGGALMFSLICAWIIGWVNNRVAGDLRRHRAYYDVTVMNCTGRINNIVVNIYRNMFGVTYPWLPLVNSRYYGYMVCLMDPHGFVWIIDPNLSTILHIC